MFTLCLLVIFLLIMTLIISLNKLYLILNPIIERYLTRNFNYWSKQGINGPKPLPLFGNFLDRAKNNIAINDLKYVKEFGTVYG